MFKFSKKRFFGEQNFEKNNNEFIEIFKKFKFFNMEISI